MNHYAHKRQQILQQLEQISQMEFGSLREEHRSSKRHPGQTQGPYYQHQVWEAGRNQSRRIPSDQAAALAHAIAERQRCEQLAQEYISTTVAMTRAQGAPDAKKNRPKSKRPSTPKPPATSSNS